MALGQKVLLHSLPPRLQHPKKESVSYAKFNTFLNLAYIGAIIRAKRWIFKKKGISI